MVLTRQQRTSSSSAPFSPSVVPSAPHASIPVTPSPPRKRSKPNPKSPSLGPSSTISTSVLTREALQSILPDVPYQDLGVSPEELRPSSTLTTGQSFGWHVVVASDEGDGNSSLPLSRPVSAWGSHDAQEWVGTLRIREDHSVAVAIRETPTTTLYRPISPMDADVDLKHHLRQYFQLNTPLAPLYEEWSGTDKRLAIISKCLPGVRILEQDPWECLVSFICSSNNNIPRITQMVTAIRREYGTPLVTIAGQTLYAFPSAEHLRLHATDQHLRQACGMGYRAKYLLETLQLLYNRGGESYLHDLRNISDPLEVQGKLCEFCGVGRKVADCVALFSLRQDAAIPVDTHVWSIARRDYDPQRKLVQVKSITPSVYLQVGELFRQRFANKPGWAHSLLFVAELPSFRSALPQEMVQEMDAFRELEKRRKQQGKA